MKNINQSPGLYITYQIQNKNINIDILLKKSLLSFDSEDKSEKIPNTLAFMIIIDEKYPLIPPNILTKSTFCNPSLMDGRDLLNEIHPQWTPKTTIRELINGIIPFLQKVVNSRGYKFYGRFNIGAQYLMENFKKMIVSK